MRSERKHNLGCRTRHDGWPVGGLCLNDFFAKCDW